jgi:ABC-type transport system involved in multi-copper enzyme maturation permease subunit
VVGESGPDLNAGPLGHSWPNQAAVLIPVQHEIGSMKYLAIFKDSFREAIDTKVFYVLAIMSLFVVILVGSISYTPVEADQAIKGIVEDQAFHLIYADKGKSMLPQPLLASLNVNNVKALTDDSEPSARDHSFELTVNEYMPYSFQDSVETWHKKPQPHGRRERFDSKAFAARVSDDQIADFFKYQFWMAGNLDVVEVKKLRWTEPDPKANPPTNGVYTFQIKTKGHSGVRGWRHDVGILFGLLSLPSRMFQTTLGSSVFFIEDTLIGGLGAWVAILVGVIITAFFIPNMLRKGTIDMLLAKPIHRTTLLVYKFVGGLTFVFLSSVIAVGGSWFVLGLRSGIWAPGFLLMIPVITFFFAILYSISTLFGVLTRSPIVAILATCVIWFFLFLVSIGYQGVTVLKKDDTISREMQDGGWGWVFTTADIVHFVLPRTGDLNVLSAKMLAQVLTEGERKAKRVDLLPDVTWGESLTVSLGFIGVMLGLACWRFSRKDY